MEDQGYPPNTSLCKQTQCGLAVFYKGQSEFIKGLFVYVRYV